MGFAADEVAGGAGATEGGLEGGGCEEVESRCSRSCCCSNIFSRAVLHLMRVGRGTLWGVVCVCVCVGGGGGGVSSCTLKFMFGYLTK